MLADGFAAGSVWSAVPLLTAIEKGFTDNELEKRNVDLLAGSNFAPEFLKRESFAEM